MTTPSDTDLGAVFRAAVQGVFGGLFGWLLTCSFAGAIAMAATANGDEPNWSWALAWVWHLAVAGIALWGLLVVCIHAFCISALVNGTDRVLRVIVIAFSVQLTTSLIVTVIMDPETWVRALVVGLPLTLLAAAYLTASLVKQYRER